MPLPPFQSRSLHGSRKQRQQRRRGFHLSLPLRLLRRLQFRLHRLFLRITRQSFRRGSASSLLRGMSGGWRSFLWRVAGGLLVLLLLYMGYVWLTLPDVSDPEKLLASQSSVITDRNGVELYRLYQEQDRTYIEGKRIPQHMKEAIIAIEDQRFYERGCLDVQALLRVAFFLGQAGGGSTITRQLARNALHLTRETLVERKIKELILGCQLERLYSKDELLELYLNWISFGQNAYGVEQASQEYFGKPAEDLTLAQSAVLAALPQRPSYLSPYGRHVYTEVSPAVSAAVARGEVDSVSEIPSEAITIGLLGAHVGTGATTLYVGGRTDQVLQNMERQGFITEKERLSALEELTSMEFHPSREDIRAPHFVLWVRNQVEELLEGTSEEGLLEQGGLRVETTLNWELQQEAQEAVERYREDIQTRFQAHNIALVALDPDTNEVLAYVGNADYSDEEHGGKIDMARAPRQPGSSFKPIVYASAFQNGYSPATPLYDVPTTIGDDKPQNFDGEFHGLMTARRALGSSRNLPAAKAYFLGGRESQILSLASALGAPTPLERKKEEAARRGEFSYGWPLALGAGETPLLEMANVYGAFARGGSALPVLSIRRITDKKGNLLYEAPDPQEEDALDERVAYQITSVLSDTSARPEGYWRKQLSIPGYETAAKTGTSNKCLEWEEDEESGERVCQERKPDNAWLLGYTPELVAGAWVGNADSEPLSTRAGGLDTASPVWRDFMIAAHRTRASGDEQLRSEFSVPEGIVTPQISTLSGELPTECTPVEHRRADVFLEETPPTEPDPACVQLTIDRVTHLLASPGCPAEARESGSFLKAHSILPERRPQWEEAVREWAEEQTELWYATPDHSGAIIPLPLAPTKQCDPSMTPGRLDEPELTIERPSQNGTASHPAFRPAITYDAGSPVREVRYAIDGRPVATVTQEPYVQTLRVPRSISRDGMHTLSVTLVDEYYNTATDRVRFRFAEDTEAPQVQFELPRGDITLPQGGTLTMRAEASDGESGVKYVQFFLGGTLLTTKPRPPYELTYPLENEASGTYTLEAEATDMAGNTEKATLHLTVTGE